MVLSIVRLLLVLLVSTSLVAQTPRLKLSLIASGLYRPDGLVVLNTTDFLVSQTDGKIILVRNGVLLDTPFLDLSATIRDPTWEGIMGFTIHPNYAANGYVYVHYSNSVMTSVFARFTRKAANPDQLDPASELILLTIPYPNGGHRSGHLAFGPDGYLYITTGDSSSGARGAVSAADLQAQLSAQNLQDLHGKLLRIDVNSGTPYSIPPTNPYASPTDGVRDEIFAYGLRNPWRWSFDRQTGDFWLGDVGQDGWEELNVSAANERASLNYGWPRYEGSHLYRSDVLPQVSYHMPLLDYAGYDHNGGKYVSITGGFVYRGDRYPALKGWYVYGDYGQGTYWTLKRETDGRVLSVPQTVPLTTSPVAFGEGPDGELYTLSLRDGKLYQIGTEAIASVRSGNWTSPDTWNCNCLPGQDDVVTITAGHVVALSQLVRVKSLRLLGKLSYMADGKLSF